MKKLICLAAALAAVAVFVSSTPQLFAQAEGVKARAKNLKKQVEGTNNPATVRTNALGTRPAR